MVWLVWCGMVWYGSYGGVLLVWYGFAQPCVPLCGECYELPGHVPLPVRAHHGADGARLAAEAAEGLVVLAAAALGRAGEQVQVQLRQNRQVVLHIIVPLP